MIGKHWLRITAIKAGRSDSGVKLYPIADHHRAENSAKKDGMILMAKRSGEFRAPDYGEWYLSGNPPHAYRAPNNLDTYFHIMTIVSVKIEIVETISICKEV